MNTFRSLIIAFLLPISMQAIEGMWLPQLLAELNIADMKSKGCKLSAEQIYSINQPSLKDAIVSFGGFCTGEIISDQGLVLTNHHCGYGAIQSVSDHLEHNYLRDGFWAMDKNQELPIEDLHVTFITEIREVTTEILEKVTPEMNESERSKAIKNALDSAKLKYKKSTEKGVIIKPFFEGLKYYMFLTEKFEDIRLVGAPPETIGKFGGDTDNWKWPRHTGDFSMFRIYADSLNRPAKYSPSNQPYVPKKSLTINAKGINEGDFTMVFGFPGTTNEYLPSYSVDHIVNTLNPTRIKLRESKMDVLAISMKSNEKIKVQYSAKYARLTNYYKKWKGENRGILRFKGIDKKQEEERLMDNWIAADAKRKIKYGKLFEEFRENYHDYNELDLTETYIYEGLYGVELLYLGKKLLDLQKKLIDTSFNQKDKNQASDKFIHYAEKFYKNFNMATDMEIYKALIQLTKMKMPKAYYLNSLDSLPTVEKLYTKSILSKERALKALVKGEYKALEDRLEQDQLLNLVKSIEKLRLQTVKPTKRVIDAKIDSLKRLYMSAKFDMEPERAFYPNANSTLRVSYGNVSGYTPRDGITARHFTTLEGIINKYNPDHIDFDLPERMLELHKKKAFGKWSMNGTVPVAFTASNHTTGGNSGSPILNAKGQLIGLNFDRNWEGTMSDLIYDPNQVRNISVDINYILFIVDKFAQASHLIDEMKIIN